MAKTTSSKKSPKAKGNSTAILRVKKLLAKYAKGAPKPTTTKAATQKSAPKKAAKPPAAKKAAPKKVAVKKVAAKKAAPKKAAPKKVAPKKAAPKKTGPKKAAPKKVAPKKAAPKKTGPKKVAARVAPKSVPMPPARSTPSLPPVEDADVEITAYTLPELARRHGSASEAEVLALIDTERSELLTLGSAVLTTRIDTDAARLYGQASDFLRTASAELRGLLLGISSDFLRIACWAANHGTELHTQRTAALDNRSKERSLDKTEAGVVRRDAMLLREQLFRALRVLSGGKSTRIAEVEIAYGSAGDGTELAKSLRAMSLVGRRFLKDPALKGRAALLGLGEAPFTAAEHLARELSLKSNLADAVHPTTGEVAQADVDLWDGINLTLLRHTIEIFAAGHARNPAIPNLYPIALRGAKGMPRTARSEKDAPNAPATDSPTKPNPT